MVLGAKRLGYGGETTSVWGAKRLRYGGETTRVKNRGETTRGKRLGGKRLGGETSSYQQDLSAGI